MRQIKAQDWGRAVIPVEARVEKASLASARIVELTGSGKAVWNHRKIREYTREGYEQNADVYACINWIATAAAGIKAKAGTRQSDDEDERTPLTDSPAAKVIQDPNPYESWPMFIEHLAVDLLSTGNAYIERVGPTPTAPPRELYIHRPERMRIVPSDPSKAITNGLIDHYEYADDWCGTPNAQIPRWYPDMIRRDGVLQPIHKILHIKLYSPTNDWYGLSPMSAAGRAIDQSNAAEEWNTSVLQNGGRPSGILAIADISEDQRSEVEDAFRAKHTGPQNVGKTIVTNGDASYTTMSLTAQEMSWLEGQDRATQRVCSAYGVPCELIGATKFRTYNNMHEAKQAGYTGAALPFLDRVFGALNHWLAPFYGNNVVFYYDKNDIEALQEDRQYLSDRAEKMVKAGIFTPNDARRVLGEKPLPAAVGDLLYLPTTVIPTKLTGKPENPTGLEPAAIGDRAITQRPPANASVARPQLVAPKKPGA